jgi:hypothetical protein
MSTTKLERGGQVEEEVTPESVSLEAKSPYELRVNQARG